MLDYIKSVCGQIGAALKKKDSFHSVVLRSTVVPGTARSVAIPILEDCSGKTAGIDFGFGNNPEFLRESTAIYDYFNPPRIVIGALDKRTVEAVRLLYKDIDAPVVIADIDVVEGIKYARQKGLNTPIFGSLLAANDEQVRRAHQMGVHSGKKKMASDE